MGRSGCVDPDAAWPFSLSRQGPFGLDNVGLDNVGLDNVGLDNVHGAMGLEASIHYHTIYTVLSSLPDHTATGVD